MRDICWWLRYSLIIMHGLKHVYTLARQLARLQVLSATESSQKHTFPSELLSILPCLHTRNRRRLMKSHAGEHQVGGVKRQTIRFRSWRIGQQNKTRKSCVVDIYVPGFTPLPLLLAWVTSKCRLVKFICKIRVYVATNWPSFLDNPGKQKRQWCKAVTINHLKLNHEELVYHFALFFTF